MRDVLGGTTALVAMVGLGIVGPSGCFSQRLLDPTLECSGGQCVCVAGRANCNGDWSDGCEIDTQGRNADCGGCGQVCTNGTCQEGVCLCAAPNVWDDCDQDPSNGCETLVQGEDENHCGECGRQCSGTELCQNGVCTERCFNGQLCGTQCVDVTQDPTHCGDCYQPCLPDEQCFDSTCQPCDEACDLCVDTDLGSVVPQHVTGFPTTNGLVSDCLTGPPSNTRVPLPGSVYRFQPPVSGHYLATTFGSAADTLISIRSLDDYSCSEIACSDDALGNGAAREFKAEAGEDILVLVASKSAISSFHQLHITETTDPACTLDHLSYNLPTTKTGNFLNASDQLQPSCAPAGGLDVAALLVAPAAGHYLIDTDGSDADTVLAVLDDHCSGPELACDDDTGDQDAQVVIELAAGQAVVVAVELRAGSPPGSYHLHVEGPL